MIAHRVAAAIASWTARVERGEVSCDQRRCPHCAATGGGFKYHATRRRCFLVIVERLVTPMMSALTRWKCASCGKTFTVYPRFALPHKRYVRDDIFRLAEDYVRDDPISYQQAVQVNTMAVCYGHEQTDGDRPSDDRVLWPSTLHRWVGWLGSLKHTLQEAWRLIRARSPGCDLFRQVVVVGRGKVATDGRAVVLQRCRRLLATDRVYQALFDISIFTKLATACRWR
jgi:transposase-like protein